MPNIYYQGTPPSTCGHCGNAITSVFSDIKTLAGSWADLCDPCVSKLTSGQYGVGQGQRYVKQSSTCKWLKVT